MSRLHSVFQATALALIGLFGTPANAASPSPLSPGALDALIGVWAAQRDFGPEVSAANRVMKNGQWIQPATSSGRPPYAIPAAFPEPLRNVEHLFLVIQRASNGALEAFFRNPESNAGRFIGLRTVLVSGDTLRLQRSGAEDVIGRFDADRASLHLSLLGLPGDFVFRKAPAADLTGFYPRSGVQTYTYHQPARSGDGWATGTLHDAGLNPKTIVAFMNWVLRTPTDSLQAPYIQSVQIARHGRLVLDEYFYGFDAQRPHDVRSAGKSITTLLVGRAIEDGAALTPASRVLRLFPQYAPIAHNDAAKERMTVANLMTMSSGLACDDNDDNSPGNEDVMQSQNAQPDWYKYALDLPMLYSPGSRAIYCSAGINLLGGIIAHVSGTWLPQYFYDRFAAPMQFGRYGLWLTSPPPETAYMAGGDYFLPRDFLKFGQLFLNYGRWNGREIIGESWLAQSVIPRTAPEGEGDRYGYGWHLSTYNVRGRSIDAINAGGNGGQLLYIFPQLDMTVMITAGSYSQFPVWRSYMQDLVPHYIISAALPN